MSAPKKATGTKKETDEPKNEQSETVVFESHNDYDPA